MSQNFLTNFFHYFLTLLPFFLVLFLGVVGVYILFNYFENRKEKIWTKKEEKLYQEAVIKKDKKLHEKMLLKKSYINSVERLFEFLFQIFKEQKKIFSLTPLDALLLIEIFPFDIKKSRDGKYYLINKEEFVFFLKLIANKNHHYINDESLLKIREKLVKELMKWKSDEKIVLDINFVFDLIKNDRIPSGDIKEQSFVSFATAFENKKTFFKLVEHCEELENNLEKNNQNKKNKIDKKNNSNFSIIKGKNKDYVIDLNTGIQYEIKKENNEEKENKNKKENKDSYIEKLLENLTLILNNQSQLVANSTKEAIKEVLNNIDKFSNNEELKKELEEKVVSQIEHKETKNQAQKLLNETFEIDNNDLTETKTIEKENIEIKQENNLDLDGMSNNNFVEDFALIDDNKKLNNEKNDKNIFLSKILKIIENNYFKSESFEKDFFKFFNEFFDTNLDKKVYFSFFDKKNAINLEDFFSIFFEFLKIQNLTNENLKTEFKEILKSLHIEKTKNLFKKDLYESIVKNIDLYKKFFGKEIYIYENNKLICFTKEINKYFNINKFINSRKEKKQIIFIKRILIK